MGYDFTGNWTNVCGHDAQLLAPTDESGTIQPDLSASCPVQASTEQQGASRHTAPYACYFPRAQGHGEAFLSEAGEMHYCDLPDVWFHVDEAWQQLRLSMLRGKGFVSFDVPSTVAAKARYAKQRVSVSLTGPGPGTGRDQTAWWLQDMQRCSQPFEVVRRPCVVLTNALSAKSVPRRRGESVLNKSA